MISPVSILSTGILLMTGGTSRRMMPRRLYSVLLVAFQLGLRISIVSSAASSRVGAVTSFNLGSIPCFTALTLYRALSRASERETWGKPPRPISQGLP